MLPARDRGVSIGHDGEDERIDFSSFSMRATKRQTSISPVRREFNLLLKGISP